MAYADLDGIHTPTNGGTPPAAWGIQANDNMAEFWRGVAQPWTNWTPTWNGITEGASLKQGMWHRIGWLVTAHTLIKLGAGFAVTGPVTVDLPHTASSMSRPIGRGFVRPFDGTPPRSLTAIVESASPTVALVVSADGDLSVSSPRIFAEDDVLSIRVTYETASAAPAGLLL